MHKEGKVGPHIVDIIEFVALDHHFHTHLDPSGHTYQKTDIPFRSFVNDLFEFLIPVFYFGDFFPWFIEGLKPEGRFFLGDPAQISRIISWSLFKIRASTQGKPAPTQGTQRNVFVVAKGEQVFDHGNFIAP